LHCDVPASSWITSRTIVTDFRKMHVGSGSLVGEYVHLIASYQPKPHILVVDDIYIGKNSFIGGYARIGAGTRIGDHTLVQMDVGISFNCLVGNRVSIGTFTRVYNN